MCTYFRERHTGQFEPADSIPALRIEFTALLRHLPSVAPNRATTTVLKNVKREVCSSKYPSVVPYIHASGDFYSALFSWDHVGNCHTKVYSSSYNNPHLPTTRTQAISDLVTINKGLISSYWSVREDKAYLNQTTKPNANDLNQKSYMYVKKKVKIYLIFTKADWFI